MGLTIPSGNESNMGAYTNLEVPREPTSELAPHPVAFSSDLSHKSSSAPPTLPRARSSVELDFSPALSSANPMEVSERDKSRRLLAYIALGVANVIWGASYVVSKQAMEEVSPMALSFWKCLLAGLVILPFCLRQLRRLRSSDWRALIVVGILFVAAPVLVQSYGLKYSLAANTALFGSLEPVWGILLATLILGEPWTKYHGFSLSLAVIGSALLTGGTADGWSLSGPYLFGNLLLILSTILYGSHAIATKPLTARIPAASLTALPFLFASLVFVPFLDDRLFPQSWMGINAVIYGGVLSCGLAFALFIWALGILPASIATMSLYSQPLLGSAFAMMVLHEPLPATFGVSTILILLAVYLLRGAFDPVAVHPAPDASQS